MKFKINNNTWVIKTVDKDVIVGKYNSEFDDKAKFVFGVTIYSKHEIWINKEMCYEQIIKTLKHELTHCYIWSYGLAQAPNFDEEMACDLVSSSIDFINEVVSMYKEKYSEELYAKKTEDNFKAEISI